MSIKLVICEKPLCGTVVEAKEIVKLYEEAGMPILVDYTRRFIPELIELKRRYDSGDFGDFIKFNIDFNRGDLHTGTHAFDFVNWFLENRFYDITQMFREGNGFDNLKDWCDYRIWQIQLFFEKYFWQEQRIGDEPVHSRYDYHTRYVIDNALGFLEGKEELKCTMYDGLKTLEIMEAIR